MSFGYLLVPRESVINPKFRSAAEFVCTVAGAVGRVAPEFGLAPAPANVWATAHAIHSTGGGTKAHARGWNFWGIKGKTNWPGRSFESGTREMTKGGVRYPIRALFRAFDTPEDAARSYFRLLSIKRYRASLAALGRGDPLYMEQLGRDGWFTGPPARFNVAFARQVAAVAKLLVECGGAAGIPGELVAASEGPRLERDPRTGAVPRPGSKPWRRRQRAAAAAAASRSAEGWSWEPLAVLGLGALAWYASR